MVIKSLNTPLNYSGDYEVVNKEWVVSGTVETDGQKNLNSISGIAKKNDMIVLSFNAWGNKDNLRWNFNDIGDLGDLNDALTVIVKAVDEIKAELERDEDEEEDE